MEQAYKYEVLSDLLTKEEVEKLLEMVVKYSGPDPKPFFEGTSLLHIETLNQGAYPLDVDPDKLLLKVLKIVKEYFLATYPMHGKFVFSRMFGASMHAGASLNPHRDEDANYNGDFDGKKRSHVCSLILNDDYEGGELIFEEHGAKIKAPAGSFVLFPGYYVSHGVGEILSGTRRVILIFFYDMLGN